MDNKKLIIVSPDLAEVSSSREIKKKRKKKNGYLNDYREIIFVSVQKRRVSCRFHEGA